ncbi:MAG: carbohydrate ABC transporter permease [Gordonia polyisoprenivorans]|nr:carbohydrate ABC transporter permease [Gordonia polyisoprenivorans]
MSRPTYRAVGERGFRPSKLIFYGILVVVAILYLYPFVLQIGTSFKTDGDSTYNPLNPFPTVFTLDAYAKLADVNFPLWFGNTVLVTVFITLGRVLFNSMAGYALSRLSFFGRRFLLAAILAVMAVPGVVLLIPKFLILNQLGMYNTYSAMIIPLLMDATGVFIMKQFFDTIPPSIEEAARIDGAGVIRRFWSVMLPMAVPALITVTVFAFQGSWNDLTHMIVARSSPETNTLTTGVAALTTGQFGSGNRYPLKLAAALVMTIPVAVVYFIFQRRLVRGQNAGGVKG